MDDMNDEGVPMTMSEADNFGRRTGRAGITFFLMTAITLLLWSPVRAESEQPAAGSSSPQNAGTTGGTVPSVSPEPATPEPTVSPLSKPPQSPIKVITESVGAPSAAPTPPTTVIGAFAGGSTLDLTKSIELPRSGGLPSLLFTTIGVNWLSTSLGLGQSYDSNVFLTSNKRSDFITTLSPAAALKYSNSLLDWNLGSSLDYRYYARGSRNEDLSYGLNTSGRVKVYRDYANILISDTYSQTSQSSSVDYTSLSSSANVTDLNTFRINPRLEIPLSSRIRFNPQYSYTNYWYPSKSSQNHQNHSVTADFSYELPAGFIPALGYNFVRSEGQQFNYNQNYPFLRIKYASDRITLTGAVGYSRMDLDSGKTSESMVWDASIAYQLSGTSFSLATSSDVDQASYLESSINRSAPQIITSYSGNMSHEFKIMTVSLSIYYRENTDSLTSDFMSRRFGASGALTHPISSRMSGNLNVRFERSDQGAYYQPVMVLGNTTLYQPVYASHSLLSQLGYGVTYSFGHDLVASCSYSYINSNSQNNPYSDNKIVLSTSKSF